MEKRNFGEDIMLHSEELKECTDPVLLKLKGRRLKYVLEISGSAVIFVFDGGPRNAVLISSDGLFIPKEKSGSICLN